jgi:hypothetical protein
MARKSDDVLAAIDEDLQEIWRTARKEYDRIVRIPEKSSCQSMKGICDKIACVGWS